MEKLFREVPAEKMSGNPFRMVGQEWMLITPGKPGDFNPMTASWGGFGVLWNQKVAFVFLRPQRYTRTLMDRFDLFTLSFFREEYRPMLEYCGTHSGKDENKSEGAGLTPLETPRGGVAFEEARLVLECRKIYFQDLDPRNFGMEEILPLYPQEDYHRLYIGKVDGVWEKRS